MTSFPVKRLWTHKYLCMFCPSFLTLWMSLKSKMNPQKLIFKQGFGDIRQKSRKNDFCRDWRWPHTSRVDQCEPRLIEASGFPGAAGGKVCSLCVFVCLGVCLCVYGLASGAISAESNQRLGQGAMWKWEISLRAKEGLVCLCVSILLCVCVCVCVRLKLMCTSMHPQNRFCNVWCL